MAFPWIPGNTAVWSSRDNQGSSHVVAIAANTQVGDIILVVIGFGKGSTTVTWPSGWTVLWTYSGPAATGYGTSSAAWRIADGTEGSSITITTSNNVRFAAVSFAVRDHGGELEHVSAASGGSATPDPPALTPSWGAAGTLWIVAESGDTRSGPPTAWPAGYDYFYVWAAATSGSGNWAHAAAAARQLNAATENPGAFTLSDGAAYVGVGTIAVKPAVGPQSATIGAAGEADSGTGLGKGLGIGAAAGAGQALGFGFGFGVGAATEAATTAAFEAREARSAGFASEAAVALLAGVALGVGTTAEADVARLLAAAEALAFGHAQESSVALGLGHGFGIGTGVEVELALGAQLGLGIGAVTEADMARVLGGLERAPLGAGSEADTGAALAAEELLGIGAATVADVVGALAGAERAGVVWASDAATAEVVAGAERKAMGRASETDAGSGAGQGLGVGAQVEADVARVQGAMVGIAVASELDMAQAVVGVSGGPLIGVAVEDDVGGQVLGAEAAGLSPTVEVDAGLAISVGGQPPPVQGGFIWRRRRRP